jgi:tight adherence protein B
VTGPACLVLLALALVAMPATPAEDRRLASLLEVQPARVPGRRGWMLSRLHRRGRWLALLTGALVVAALAGPAAGLAAGVVAAAALTTVQSTVDRRAAGRAEDAVLEAVEALAAELRAGLPPAAALRSAAEAADGPVAAVLTEAASTAALGGDAAEVLRAAATQAEGLQRVSAAWQVSSTSGASLSDVLDRVENDLRGDRTHGRRVDAELAGPRATAGLLAVLPLLGLGLGASMGADPGHVLRHTVPGQLALVIGAGLDALGVWWTARIIASAQGAA